MSQTDQIASQALIGLKSRREFLHVRGGRSERRRSLVVQARPSTDSTRIGVGFTATRKVGSAVIRNRSKRRLREAARQLLPKYGLPGVDYVFIARRDTASVCWQRLLDDMETALISLAGQIPGGPDRAKPDLPED